MRKEGGGREEGKDTVQGREWEEGDRRRGREGEEGGREGEEGGREGEEGGREGEEGGREVAIRWIHQNALQTLASERISGFGPCNAIKIMDAMDSFSCIFVLDDMMKLANQQVPECYSI